MTTLGRVITVGGLLLAASCAASAAEIGYDVDFTGVLTDITNSPLTLTDFNSSLGTLTGVFLYLHVVETGSSSLENTSSGTQSFDLTVGSTIKNPTNTADNVTSNKYGTVSDDFIDTPNGVGPGEDPSNPTQYTLGATNGGPVVNCPVNTPSASCNSVNFTGLTVDNTLDEFGNPVSGTGTGYLGTYGLEKTLTSFKSFYTHGGGGSGSGTFNLLISTTAFYTLSGQTSNLVASRSTTVSAYAEVDYIYTPVVVPEPATFWLIGSAVLGLGLLRHRLRKA
jgi:hypothetical protein